MTTTQALHNVAYRINGGVEKHVRVNLNFARSQGVPDAEAIPQIIANYLGAVDGTRVTAADVEVVSVEAVA